MTLRENEVHHQERTAAMADEERDDLIERCAKAAEAEINRAREDGETDLRSVRAWVSGAIRSIKHEKTA